MLKRFSILGGLILAVMATAAFVNRPEAMRSVQSTKDAYLQADYTNVAPRISATVVEVLVKENQYVDKGAVLARLDDRDQKIAVQTAQAALDAARANLRMLRAETDMQDLVIEQANATLEADHAALTLAQTQEKRLRKLVARKSSPQSLLDEALSNLTSAEAALRSDTAKHDAARRQIEVYAAQQDAAKAAVSQAEVALANAQLELSYTMIVAPISGTVGQMNLRVGGYAPAGNTLASIVPLQNIYVEARFRETQLARVRPGQPVRFSVDGIPGHEFTGTVDSIGPASGASYSALSAQNATGNFTKVAQRLPVRISVDPDQANADIMRVGMSVVPRIDVSG
ncbi:HlyD family secretion protein [Paracoccus sp. Z330]|uniref:HlyD family secretion protein n=1 Tax=Paracoccus onchidii TaxID=3017813 RepID=A0ABT4ZIB1_9RHOB|nr:HlyD family secretion protein [Paracoccus onchidii]MDB6179098.1 HlyD family secretion protein [Paracoccus onchidii]